jgi:hypothetical protein
MLIINQTKALQPDFWEILKSSPFFDEISKITGFDLARPSEPDSGHRAKSPSAPSTNPLKIVTPSPRSRFQHFSR